jgi:hypothetical protein
MQIKTNSEQSSPASAFARARYAYSIQYYQKKKAYAPAKDHITYQLTISQFVPRLIKDQMFLHTNPIIHGVINSECVVALRHSFIQNAI